LAQFVRKISGQVGLVIARPAVSITGAIVGGFVVSFVLMWQARGPAAANTAGAPSRTLPAVEPPALPTSMAPPRADSWGPPVRRAPAGVRANLPQPSAAPTDESDPTAPMPVGINVYNRRARHRIEGYVANTSNKPLSVTLERVGAEGRGNSTLSIELPPGGRRDFSSDSGLDLQTNDQVVVHSEPYQDISIQVP
jgi:hypothetical protein